MECRFFTDLEFDYPNGPCPQCCSKLVSACQSCHREIFEEGVDGGYTQCYFCGADVRRLPPPIVDDEAEGRERRIAIACATLDEVVLLVMQKVAAQAGITQEELAEACEGGTEDGI
jgi:hypothetical protein